jgi:hypothetical protein
MTELRVSGIRNLFTERRKKILWNRTNRGILRYFSIFLVAKLQNKAKQCKFFWIYFENIVFETIKFLN